MLGFITNIFELIAAFAGFYYLSKNRTSKLRSFVYFLVITVFVDAIGSYAILYNTIGFLKPIETTIFKENLWLYNTFVIGSLFFYIHFYKTILKSKRNKKILNILLLVSVLIVTFNIYRSGLLYFTGNLKYNFTWTTFSVFICTTLFFFELLMSDRFLLFYKSPIFYISIGLLFWWLIFPPLIFYMPYYKEIYPEMVNLRETILILTNIFLYGCYTIGFVWGKEQ